MHFSLFIHLKVIFDQFLFYFGEVVKMKSNILKIGMSFYRIFKILVLNFLKMDENYAISPNI